MAKRRIRQGLQGPAGEDATLSDSTPLPTAASASAGTAQEASRADHVHLVHDHAHAGVAGDGGLLADATLPSGVASTASAGTSTKYARIDHVHTIDADTVDASDIDWGTGPTQVDAALIPIDDTGGYFTTDYVEDALAELGPLLSSQGYTTPLLPIDGNTFTMSVAGRVWCFPFVPDRTMTVSHIVIAVVSAAGNLRAAIYDDSGGNPANLKAESGSVAAAANKMEIALGSSVQLTAGSLYWFCVQSDTTTCTARGPQVRWSGGGTYMTKRFDNAGGYGAFEDPRTSATSQNNTPGLLGRISSVP